jgi:hypothetical protein
MMTETDYKECRYIDIEMRFTTYDSFLEDARAIKRLYKQLNHKIFYKWYVYANIHISLDRKNKMWCYLNDDLTYEQLVKLTKKN